jgi:hypothetical protein
MSLAVAAMNPAAVFLKKALMLSFFIILFKSSSAQVIDSTAAEDSTFYIAYIPKYDWSLGIEHSYIPGIFTQNAFRPDNLEVSWWLNQRFYLQAGIFSASADTVPGTSFFTHGFAIYAGTTLKLFLFRNGYFTPSLNIYFDKYPANAVLEDWSIALGPTASFEYFISDRISFRADLFNVNIGIASPFFFSDFPVITLHRILGLGVRYSFNWKQAPSE